MSGELSDAEFFATYGIERSRRPRHIKARVSHDAGRYLDSLSVLAKRDKQDIVDAALLEYCERELRAMRGV